MRTSGKYLSTSRDILGLGLTAWLTDSLSKWRELFDIDWLPDRFFSRYVFLVKTRRCSDGAGGCTELFGTARIVERRIIFILFLPVSGGVEYDKKTVTHLGISMPPALDVRFVIVIAFVIKTSGHLDTLWRGETISSIRTINE